MKPCLHERMQMFGGRACKHVNTQTVLPRLSRPLGHDAHIIGILDRTRRGRMEGKEGRNRGREEGGEGRREGEGGGRRDGKEEEGGEEVKWPLEFHQESLFSLFCGRWA